jgi:hypothetical protein
MRDGDHLRGEAGPNHRLTDITERIMSGKPVTSARRSGLLVLPLLLALGFVAHAQEVEVASGLICDTQEQVEQFVALYDGDAQDTAERVNAKQNNPTACVVSGMAYVRGRNLATARTKDTTFQIVPILVLGVVTSDGIQPVAPARYFSAIAVKEIDV